MSKPEEFVKLPNEGIWLNGWTDNPFNFANPFYTPTDHLTLGYNEFALTPKSYLGRDITIDDVSIREIMYPKNTIETLYERIENQQVFPNQQHTITDPWLARPEPTVFPRSTWNLLYGLGNTLTGMENIIKSESKKVDPEWQQYIEDYKKWLEDDNE